MLKMYEIANGFSSDMNVEWRMQNDDMAFFSSFLLFLYGSVCIWDVYTCTFSLSENIVIPMIESYS